MHWHSLFLDCGVTMDTCDASSSGLDCCQRKLWHDMAIA